MAFAVAMNEWLTVMTSSPGPTPRAKSARCRAMVQFETAQACGAPTKRANSRSKADTSGPCVTQLERKTAATAPASSSPIEGFISGISTSATPLMTHGFGAGLAPRPPADPVVRDNLLQQFGRRFLATAIPRCQILQALPHSDTGREP